MAPTQGMRHADGLRYRAVGNRPVALVALLVAIGLASRIISPDANVSGQRLLSILMLIPVLLVGVTAGASSSIRASADGVRAFTVLGPRSWRWEEIHSFLVETRATGLLRYQRRVLGIQLRSGETRWLTEISSRLAGDSSESRVDVLAHDLNELSLKYRPR